MKSRVLFAVAGQGLSRQLPRRFRFIVATFVVVVAVGAPAAWAVGWTPVGTPDQPINSWPSWQVITANPVHSSNIRLFVHTPPGTGIANNTEEGYIYPSGITYAYGYFQPWEDTPDYLGISGGNKYAECAHYYSAVPGNPLATCQRYSTT